MAEATYKPVGAKEKVRVDWEAVERDYRVGQLTVRQIAEKHGCSVSGLMSRAKREGWTRDLSEAVALATKAKVREKVVAKVKEQAEQIGTEIGTESERSTFSEIDLAANVNATIILGQQSRVGRLASLFEKMTGELEVVNADPATLKEIAKAVEEQDPKAAEAIGRLRSMTSRMNNLKTATEIMGRLNDAENSAFKLGENNAGNQSVDSLLQSIADEEGL